ncbi:MAG: hypothetical protein ACREH6_07385, partial [Geminicoccaceae bacterium]
VQHAGQAIDPFVGAKRGAGCGPGEQPLWRTDVLAQLAYQPVILAAAGIAPSRPEAEDARRGYFDEAALPTTSPALVAWVDAFWVEKGDRLTFRLLGPDLRAAVERAIVLEKDYPRWFGFAGGRRPGERWPAGTYRAEVTLERTATDGGAVRAAIAREIELR